MRRAERVRAFTQSARHAAHRVLGERRHQRQDHDAHHDAGSERVEAGERREEPLQQRRHEQQREVAVDDRRDAREELEHRFHDAPDAASRRTHSDRPRSGVPSAARPASRSSETSSRAERRAAARRSAVSRRAESTRCRTGTPLIGTSRRKPAVSTVRTTMMPIVVPIESSAQQKQPPLDEELAPPHPDAVDAAGLTLRVRRVIALASTTARGSGRPGIRPRRTPCRPCARRSASLARS